METNIIKSKKNERWVIYAKNIEATKNHLRLVLMDAFHTIDKVPDVKIKKYLWQKQHF